MIPKTYVKCGILARKEKFMADYSNARVVTNAIHVHLPFTKMPTKEKLAGVVEEAKQAAALLRSYLSYLRDGLTTVQVAVTLPKQPENAMGIPKIFRAFEDALSDALTQFRQPRVQLIQRLSLSSPTSPVQVYLIVLTAAASALLVFFPWENLHGVSPLLAGGRALTEA